MNEPLARAELVLRPRLEDVLEAWRVIVTAEREQVEALPHRPRPEDFYAPVAERFREDPRRTDDETLNALIELTRPDETWLDLGAGGGRYTLALALHLARVYAVEPSEGMRDVLEDGMRTHAIDNVEVFGERWPGESSAPVADVGFISQVGYDIAEIGPFLDQLEAHSRRACVAVLLARSPTAEFAALWQPVHGIERVVLPGLREFIDLLFARGRVPEVRLLHLPARSFASLDEMQAAARRPLWTLEGSAEDARLTQAIRRAAKPHGDRFVLESGERALGIVVWRPRPAGAG